MSFLQFRGTENRRQLPRTLGQGKKDSRGHAGRCTRVGRRGAGSEMHPGVPREAGLYTPPGTQDAVQPPYIPLPVPPVGVPTSSRLLVGAVHTAGLEVYTAGMPLFALFDLLPTSFRVFSELFLFPR